MKKMVEFTFRAYTKKATEITKGFITEENINWVTDHLMLKELTNQELSEMWQTIDNFFKEIMGNLDENGEVISWKPFTEEIAFAMDTDSAWKEVVNMEARRRKAEGTL